MSKNIKVGFVSLGCPKNLVDTEVMLAEVVAAGYEITPEETEADVIIINTCAFIESAKREAIDNILDVAWLKKNHKLRAIIVTGCLPERYGKEILDEMPEVDAIIGVGSTDCIVEAIEAALKKSGYESLKDKNESKLGGDRVVTTGEMAYLKIAEGCNNRCSYCAIPDIRGKMRSRTVEDIVSEARDLDKMGVRELVLVAQDTSAYGLDLYGEYRLPALIREICAATSIPWIRLLYCYPDKITDELLTELRDNPRLVKYIDIPVQHISDRVLARMNRHGDSAVVRGAIKRLREWIPGITLRTTAIVGFPGETEEEFTELCEFINEARFERFGAFTYSAEEGTVAATMDDQIDEDEKQRRYDILMRHQLKISEEQNEAKLGATVTVLCEGFDSVAETYYGRSEADAPEIDGKVYFSAPEGKYSAGDFVCVKICEAMDYDLVGQAVMIPEA